MDFVQIAGQLKDKAISYCPLWGKCKHNPYIRVHMVKTEWEVGFFCPSAHGTT